MRKVMRVASMTTGPRRYKLTRLEADFVMYYIGNGRKPMEAAVMAGYAKRSAASIGGHLLEKPHIRYEIDRRSAMLAEKHFVTADRVIGELAKLAFANHDDLFCTDISGMPQFNWSRLTRDQKATIAEMTYEVVGFAPDPNALPSTEEPEKVPVRKVKVKLYDKRQALVDLARYLGLFDGRASSDPTPAIPQQIIQQNLTLIGLNAEDAAATYMRLIGGRPS